MGAISPVLVPMFAASFGGSLLNGMMMGLVGSAVSLAFACALPETAGRLFAVVESKARDPEMDAVALPVTE